MKKFSRMVALIVFVLVMAVLAVILCSCSEADKVNLNITEQAGYFECERKITVYNARTDTIIFECEGYMDISNTGTDELVVTCKVAADSYKKNYIYLNENIIYVVEDITGTHTDPYHYHWYWHTEILPTIEVKP